MKMIFVSFYDHENAMSTIPYLQSYDQTRIEVMYVFIATWSILASQSKKIHNEIMNCRDDKMGRDDVIVDTVVTCGDVSFLHY